MIGDPRRNGEMNVSLKEVGFLVPTTPEEKAEARGHALLCGFVGMAWWPALIGGALGGPLGWAAGVAATAAAAYYTGCVDEKRK
jgi:cytochrome c biogenesis protein CcdA